MHTKPAKKWPTAPERPKPLRGKHRVFEPVSTEHCVRTRTRVCVSGATVSRGHVRTQRKQPQKVAKVRARARIKSAKVAPTPYTPLVPPGGRRVGAGCGGRAPSRRAGPTGAARHNKTAAEQAGNIKPKLRTVLSLCMSIVTEPCSLSGTAFIRLYRYQLSPVERNDTPPLSVVCSVLFTVPPRGVL